MTLRMVDKTLELEGIRIIPERGKFEAFGAVTCFDADCGQMALLSTESCANHLRDLNAAGWRKRSGQWYCPDHNGE